MKLVILIPAYNEEENIQKVILSIPRKINGIDEIQVMVIDDGSTDNTVELALNAGAEKVISHNTNEGVGSAFMTGIRNAISMNAGIVVTLDADSQFDPNQIPKLVLPILNDQLDVVIGSRFLENNPTNMPKVKLIGNKFFTNLVSWAIGKKFTDTQTGFRAYSRKAILNISVVNEFTYTQEVLIDLKFKGFKISEVPVTVNYNYIRKSRVVKNIFDYSYRALSIILRTLIYHRPILAFGLFGIILGTGGIIAKILTISEIFIVSAGLSTGLIILGIVSVMLGGFASIVFKRQAFTEKDLRHYLKEANENND